MQRPVNPSKATNSAARKARVKQERFQAAQERQAKRDTLTPDQQLAILDGQFGVNQGAKKERDRLNRKLIYGFEGSKAGK
jgi:hypothetical protein